MITRLTPKQREAVALLLTKEGKVYTGKRTSEEEMTIHVGTAYTLWRMGLLRYWTHSYTMHNHGQQVEPTVALLQLNELSLELAT